MKKILSVIKYLIFFGIGVFLLWLAFKNQDKKQIIDGFEHANYFWVGVSLFLMLLSHISRAVRWTMLIKPLGFKVSTRNAFVGVMLGYLANLALPRMGELTRCIVLNRTDKIPLNKLVGTVFVERALDFIMLMSIVFLTVILEFNRLSNFYFDVIHPGLVDKVGKLMQPQVLIVLIVLFLAGIGFLIYLNKRYKENPIIAKFRELVKGFVSGIKTIRSMDNNWLFLAHSVFIWFMYWLMTYVVFFALDATKHLGVLAGLTTFAIGSVGFIMPVQGGIGTFHWAVREGLKIYHVNPSDGIIYATLMHGSQTLGVILLGAICFVLFLFIQRKNSKNAQANAYKAEDTATPGS